MKRFTIFVLFFLSGSTGLIYEVSWTRMLTAILGSNTYATTSVISAFMGGLAFGSWMFGKLVKEKKNILLICAALEASIALIVLIIPHALDLFSQLYPFIYQHTSQYPWLLLGIKLSSTFIILIIPTVLMGGTLPLICRYFLNSLKSSGRQIGVLYSINTVGATVGCFITGFFLIEKFGILETTQIAASINIAIALGFFSLHIFSSKADQQHTASLSSNENPELLENHAVRSPVSKIVLVAYFFSGYTALSYEVLWSRLLVFKLKMSIYAFSLMLTSFLLGIALGSLLFSIFDRYLRIKKPLSLFGTIEIFIGITGLSTILLFNLVDRIPMFESIGNIPASESWYLYVLKELVLSAMIMLVPTTLMGMTFPLLNKIYIKNIPNVGKTIGELYFINTIGGIIGSCLTGFYLAKLLGTQNAIILTSFIAMLAGTLVYTKNQPGEKSFKLKAIIVGFCWVFFITTALSLPSNFLSSYYNLYEESIFPGTKLLYANEGLECVTTVHQYPDGERGISTSSVNVAGTHYTHRTTQKLQAHIPLLIHPNPQTVLQVGFGSGETSHLVTTYDTTKYDLVEISDEVIQTSSKYFTDLNNGVVNSPKFNSIIMDGANYLFLTNEKYDVILNDASWPGYAGCSSLYSKDYFEHAKNKLKKGGIITSWFPIVEGDDFQILLKTIHSVFPHVTVWLAMTHVNKHVLVMASLEETIIEYDNFIRRFNAYAKEDLKLVDLEDPLLLLDTCMIDQTALLQIPDSVPIHTKNHPILEFTESKKDEVENIESINFIRKNLPSLPPIITQADLPVKGKETIIQKSEKIRRSTSLVMDGYTELLTSNEYIPQFESKFTKSLEITPHHPGAKHFCLNMLNTNINIAENFAQKGSVSFARNYFSVAFQQVNHLLKLFPQDSNLYYKRAFLYTNGGEYFSQKRRAILEQALTDIESAILLEPKEEKRSQLKETKVKILTALRALP